jgi:hypothetical protein
MAHYYYPLTSRDFVFENIFSSETVSPAGYYAKRSFGFDYFPVLPGVNDEQAILLFDQPPVYKDDNNAKFILKIADSVLNPNELVSIAEGVFAYYGTIYFEKDLINVLFFSTKDIKIAVLKAYNSLPTKVTEKYSDSFVTINETDCHAFPAVAIDAVKADDKIALKVALDKRFNHFKGFIYGFIIGQMANDRKRELGLKNRFQDITNAFAELKSRIDNQPSAKGKTSAPNGLHIYIEKLFRSVSAAESEYDMLRFGDGIDEQKLVEYLLHKLSRLKSAQEVTLYLNYIVSNDELLGSSDYKKIVDGYILDRRSSSKIFQELRYHIQQFINVFQLPTKQTHTADELNNRIKLILRNATEAHLNQLSSRSYDLTADLDLINYDFTKNEISLNGSQSYLNTTGDNEFTFIINAILKFAKSNKGPARKEMILKIVEEVGSSYTKGGKETLLYQYLENRIDVYSLEKATNLVMKNFVAFIFNPDSIEKLDDFLMSKSVEERWIAFSFWGAYNGFANTSRNYAAEIFSAQNIQLQHHIDAFLKPYVSIVVHTIPEIAYPEVPVEIDNKIPITSGDQVEDRMVSFFKLQVVEHFKLSFEEFSKAMKFTDQKEFQEELKSKYQITKKDSLKLFNAIKKYLDPTTLFH